MFHVFVVDDEPAAVDFLCALIERHCPGYQVIGTASNGHECLQKLEVMCADVVLSDVKMPIMDGVELARRLKEEHPEVATLIVSGYREYDYVRDSLKNGVFDYLLKPLIPSVFSTVLEKLRISLENSLRVRRNRMLMQLSQGKQFDPRELTVCFPDTRYDCVLVRRNGLPRRFTHVIGHGIYAEAEDGLLIDGRDEMERICLRPSAPNIEQSVLKIMAQESIGGSYITAAATREPFHIDQFPDVLNRLYRTLDVRTILGRTQAIYLDDHEKRMALPPDATEDIKTLVHLLSMGMVDRAKVELKRLMDEWEDKDMPQLWLERQLRYIVYFKRQRAEEAGQQSDDEHLLDDAFYLITSMEELYDYVADILLSMDVHGDCQSQRVDSPEMFERVTDYICKHFAEPLSLQSISRGFGISQGYLNKMFRKYEGKSFIAYLTQARMEHAKELLTDASSLYVKDIAALVGYTDPFYFSRAFRAYVGMAPSEYTEKTLS